MAAKDKEIKEKKISKLLINISTFTISQRNKVLLGSFLFLFGLALFISFISYLVTWKQDQSILSVSLTERIEANNWLSKFGANVSHFFMFEGFGIVSMYISILISLTGLYYFFNLKKTQLKRFWFWGLYLILYFSILFSILLPNQPIFGGMIGYETSLFIRDYIGTIGLIFLLVFFLILYLVVRLGVTPEKIITSFKRASQDLNKDLEDEKKSTENLHESEQSDSKTVHSFLNEDTDSEVETLPNEAITSTVAQNHIEENATQVREKIIIKSPNSDVEMEVEAIEEEDVVDELSKKLVQDYGEFDPTLELSNFQFPTIELLKDYNKGKGITIDQSELEDNKNTIVETLKNYKIGIAEIKATVGPTVTLYEIIPDAGIRISKIKNLEDDIALSLSALGIRIIAPMPGKGTIGIEVPNQNPTMVPMRSVVSSSKFQQAEMALPIALGKTISNETFVVDLAKMPHLLMAGATGQGKSVGLNVILTSLLYQKHPAEVKFVLVDPKKVELTLFNKIERHYLAKMPDVEEAIITDNSKVINTLNSLCIEMDTRYDLLKDAMVRNIKEYNEKFKARKLNPQHGHKFLPYIVLVVDEFADLIMTAGKEVETPIARLAQLARAIGIHLIIATQRPSVNVITGMIKANFPARIAFRVTSKIDSRTILDSGGADQLIGKGDMLFTQGNELIRLQCAFIDTPEVDRITDFIGSQKAYPEAHFLPEYVGEDNGTLLDDNIEERDNRFNEAAEIIVAAQQGSASLLQRKMKLGYNRAGRLIDQLEAAGIVGPFEGSKARQVLISDINTLHDILNEDLTNNSTNEDK